MSTPIYRNSSVFRSIFVPSTYTIVKFQFVQGCAAILCKLELSPLGVFNTFHIVFNISTLLNFITTECFNNSTSYSQFFQHCFLLLFSDATLKKVAFQLFHRPYYYVYNKLYNNITRAHVRASTRARARANKHQ